MANPMPASNFDRSSRRSAIERRTAALGGHVERRDDAAMDDHFSGNSCRNRDGQAQGGGQGMIAAEREAELAAGAVLPRRCSRCRPGSPASPSSGIASGLRPAVQGIIRGRADDRGRSRASWRPHRHRRAYTWPDQVTASPPCPHDRAGRRHLARWLALAGRAAGLQLAALVPVLTKLFQADGRSSRRPPCRPVRDFLGPHAHLAERRAFAAFHRAQDHVVRLCKAPVRRTQGGARLSGALYPPASPTSLQQAIARPGRHRRMIIAPMAARQKVMTLAIRIDTS